MKIQSELKKNQPDLVPIPATLDHKLVANLSSSRLPRLKQLKYLPKVLSSSELMLVRGLMLIILAALAFVGVRMYLTYFPAVPSRGGEYTEALIGAPRYINPLLAQTNDVDLDLSKLIFSGLLQYDKNLELIPDLAENYSVSDDQKTYVVTLRDHLTWHDDWPLTADDVVFTYHSAQDPNFKSPLIESLRGIKIEKTGERQITFTLSESYAPFLELLTIGILPEHVWGEIPPFNANLTEFNLKPVGSGPWRFHTLTKDRLGNIRTFTVERNPAFYREQPYIDRLNFKFYPDFLSAIEALNNRSVDGISYVPKDVRDKVKHPKVTFYSLYVPQYTAVFFNQKNNDLLKDKNIRQALSLAIDKTKILTEALRLQGEIIDGPILPGFLGYSPDLAKIPYDPLQAQELLKQAGWDEITPDQYQKSLSLALAPAATSTSTTTPDLATTTPPVEPEPEEEPSSQSYYRQKNNAILKIKLTTVNFSENVNTAELIKTFWENIGVAVELEIVEHTRIVRETIRPRNYEALLYGEIIGADPDPYPFWHSSQSEDPGLNLAVFANRNIDKLLEDARLATSADERKNKYIEFQNLIIQEYPAIFLYSPSYAYVLHQKIKAFEVDRIVLPRDRFNNSEQWYIETARHFKNPQP